MKIISWNVNSIRARVLHVKKLLHDEHPAILMLQETKVQDDDFPFHEFSDMDYKMFISGQKSYNGVAIFSKLDGHTENSFVKKFDEQKRFIMLETNNFIFINVYVPNGNLVGTEKYEYKLKWFNSLKLFLKEIIETKKMILIGGDFNIAPFENDIYNFNYFEKKILCTKNEIKLYKDLIEIGFYDVFYEKRLHEYTWWDYRINKSNLNNGARIDHFFCNQNKNFDVKVLKEYRLMERPSDHAPILLENT